MQLLNFNNLNKSRLKISNKTYHFVTMECTKPRMKFKQFDNFILVKVNNNLSLKMKKSSNVLVKLSENSIFFRSKNLAKLNLVMKKLYKFCTYLNFLK